MDDDGCVIHQHTGKSGAALLEVFITSHEDYEETGQCVVFGDAGLSLTVEDVSGIGLRPKQALLGLNGLGVWCSTTPNVGMENALCSQTISVLHLDRLGYYD